MSYMGEAPGSRGEGEPRAELDALFNLAYAELRRLATSVKRSDFGSTINPTALVHEAWLKLSRSPELGATSTLHFKRIAARAMRQILIESARRRKASKRSGGEGAVFVTFDESAVGTVSDETQLLALDDALQDLARMEPRQALLVESRFFGGLEMTEISALLNVSEATILRDWRAAKAWLGVRLRQAR